MWDAAEENVRSDRMRSQQTWNNDVRGTILQSSANVQNQAPDPYLLTLYLLKVAGIQKLIHSFPPSGVVSRIAHGLSRQS